MFEDPPFQVDLPPRKPGNSFRRGIENRNLNAGGKMFVSKPSNIKKQLKFDDPDTITLAFDPFQQQPQQEPQENNLSHLNISIPTLSDLLKDFNNFQQSQVMTPGTPTVAGLQESPESSIFKSKVSFRPSPLVTNHDFNLLKRGGEAVFDMKPKTQNNDHISFGEPVQSKFTSNPNDTTDEIFLLPKKSILKKQPIDDLNTAAFNQILSKNRQLNLDLDDDTIPLRPVQSKLQQKQPKPKEKEEDLTINKSEYPKNDQINTLPTTQINTLPTSQINTLPTTQINALPAAKINTLPMTQTVDKTRQLNEAISTLQNRTNSPKENSKAMYTLLCKCLPFKVTCLMTNTTFKVSIISKYKQISNAKLTSTNTVPLFSHIAIHSRDKKYHQEMISLLSKVPYLFLDHQNVSFVVSSKVRNVRFALVFTIPNHYPWCRLPMPLIRVDFGIDKNELQNIIRGTLESLRFGPNLLTRFVDEILAIFP
ncbi:hypothetical protein GPJ56_008261 [Histomonas meleagridis]|uniref:uncharacterized protein n=1 Tax=Histomonas meleagridis TaxID=135588 RepID=UPI00355937C3|nr:hypothetical protein GPJ56_008261 [Histomonas meleagridis]KAH0797282.1 hypothetical protein GO595_009964 [Histomonas meleagridis]